MRSASVKGSLRYTSGSFSKDVSEAASRAASSSACTYILFQHDSSGSEDPCSVSLREGVAQVHVRLILKGFVRGCVQGSFLLRLHKLQVGTTYLGMVICMQSASASSACTCV